MFRCAELYQTRMATSVASDFIAGHGLDEIYGMEYAFAYAGDLHNPTLSQDEIVKHLHSGNSAYRFLIAGNSNLNEEQRNFVKEDPFPIIAAAGFYMDPDVQSYPEEWLQELSGFSKDLFKNPTWLNMSSDFDRAWYAHFMKEVFPSLYSTTASWVLSSSDT